MKKYKQNILQIFVLAILLVSGAFVFAFSGPTSTPLVEDAQGPIKATGVGQYIGEKSFADLINLNDYSLLILGKQDNSILGNASSQFLNVSNSVTVDEGGDVFVTSLSGTGTQNVCLNSQHKLVRCSGPTPILTNGECKSYPNTYLNQPATSSSTGCVSGLYQDSTDTSTTWNWKCNGTNGGTDANCTANFPYPTTNACYTGFYEEFDPSHPNGGSVTYTNSLGEVVTKSGIWLGEEEWISYKTGTSVSSSACSPC
jgi:hypothetical protein